MIVFLDGKLIEKEPTFVVLENRGIGYKINISLNTFSRIKKEDRAQFFTHLQVREDAHTLYGFSEKAEKEMFLNLISVNGIGANTSMVILSCMSPEELNASILGENITALQRIKGIGKKSAQRIIIELKDKLKKHHTTQSTISPRRSVRDEACNALMTLGVSKVAAEKSIDTIILKSDDEIPLERLIKLALKSI